MNPNAIETMTVVAATVADAHGDDVDDIVVWDAPADPDSFARSKIKSWRLRYVFEMNAIALLLLSYDLSSCLIVVSFLQAGMIRC